ncbi:MAG: DUF2236 domain-containing protein, partial [Bacteroidota bacterium]|nr:DUF2236 domain-containing protein [Bacteroidota bacterium]MDX5431865.1 DUF2236 domain-containing protein [Bacteroidota bacterium]MDX5470579.1 DUF2236 domain-containing protein [Bacteroidota bacterium]
MMGEHSWTNTELDLMRKQGDLPGDTLLQTLLESGNTHQFASLMQLEMNQDELPQDLDPKLNTFAHSLHQLPEWADPKKIALAEDFFQTYQIYVYSALLFASLPYCYAAGDGAKVLYHSQRIQNQTGKRLSETGQYIMDFSEPGAFSPSGKAFKSILKVRFIHAAVRNRLLSEGNWNASWGVPVNMEDMAG